MKAHGYYYVATPYTRYPGGHEAAYEMACVVTAKLLLAGVPVYSPIAHTHGIAMHGRINNVDHDFWMDVDRPMLNGAVGVIVVEAPGWDKSAGVAHEIEHAKGRLMPVYRMQPDEVPAHIRELAK